MPFFFHEDGRVLPPTARRIWDRLVAGDTILECRQASAPANILEKMGHMAEEYARPLYQELLQRHRERLARLRRKANTPSPCADNYRQGRARKRAFAETRFARRRDSALARRDRSPGRDLPGIHPTGGDPCCLVGAIHYWRDSRRKPRA